MQSSLAQDRSSQSYQTLGGCVEERGEGSAANWYLRKDQSCGVVFGAGHHCGIGHASLYQCFRAPSRAAEPVCVYIPIATNRCS